MDYLSVLNTKYLSFKKAFTLAETLIVLVIIGIIAIIVLPPIISNVIERETKTGIKKAYSILSNALNRATLDNGNTPIKCYYALDGTSGATSECTELMHKLLNYLLIGKYCAEGKGVTDGCIIQYSGCDSLDPPCSDSTWYGSYIPNKEAIVLQDGMAIMPYYDNFTRSTIGNAIIAVDLNGIKPPNKGGYDLFFFQIRGSDSFVKLLPLPYTFYVEDGGHPSSYYLKNY